MAPSRKFDAETRVPLALAWRTGAAGWTRTQRVAFANDPIELVAVEGAVNESKGDGGPEAWAPTVQRCGYAPAFVVRARCSGSKRPAQPDPPTGASGGAG